ncbi:RNA polymerase sigma factor SigZ [Fulvivirga kasyanovii]|uniref:Sigma-70 family RNA polymerase sigma factor n=1 Tax=Fulvivirga kasyanovii TaxID=396812 RepID=A0ABW9RR65_9BACT|nr:sigma-70 family RNA polymerase sigma factor [Fulvivirga kasyanovii]MTI25774.1 sigma-70 family RNA polymerase sigma factor [Fulvivirga kasyanovii]
MEKNFNDTWESQNANLLTFIRSKTGEEELADDLLQEVGLKLYQAFASGVEIRNHTAWLFQVARNTISDHYRKRDTIERGKENLLSLTAKADSQNCVCDLSGFIIKNYLPQQYSSALYLSDIEQVPQKQIALQLGLTLTATKSRIQRGRQKLKEIILGCVNVEWNDRGEPVDFQLKNTCELPEELLKEISRLNLMI